MTEQDRRTELEQRKARLTPEQRARLLERAGAARAVSAQTIPRLADDGPVPLSSAQARLWFLHKLAPDAPNYNEVTGVSLQGPLDLARLEQALAYGVLRHETLRTVFIERAGEPMQKVLPAAPLDLRRVDLRERPREQRMDALRAYALARVRAPFDLAAGPLIRFDVVRVDADTHALFVHFHHIVADGLSIMTFVREVSLAYEALAGGVVPRFPEPSVRYRDFAAFQHATAQQHAVTRSLTYWQRQLDGVTPLALPYDFAREAHDVPAQDERIATVLSVELSERVRKLARDTSSTLFVTLLAAFQWWLRRSCDQHDVTVGVPSENRDHPELEGVVGFFVNTLLLRGRVDDTKTVAAWIAQTQRSVLDAQQHQAAPFERVAELVRANRGGSAAPLPEVMLVVHSVIEPQRTPSGLTLSPLSLDHGSAKFELTLFVADRAQLELRLEYAAQRFRRSSVERMLAQLAHVLDVMSVDAARRLDDLPRLSPADRTLLRALVPAGPSAALTSSAEALIAEQASAHPERPALTFVGETASYRQLWDAVERLAAQLREKTKPGDTVAIRMERSAESVVAVVAALHIGATILALDPSGPLEREQSMLADAQPALVLVDQSSGPHGHELLRVGKDLWSAASDRAPSTAAVRIADDSLAYLVFTSGSTGTPKGTMNTRRGLANLLQWQREFFSLREDDCVLHKTACTFDVSVWEYVLAFSAGARLVVAEPEGHRDPEYLAALIVRERVTMVHFVPSMLRLFLASPRAPACANVLRYVLCGGEALDAQLVHDFHQRLPGVRLFNMYGPAEAAVDVCAALCSEDATRGVSIGSPVLNARAYIVDEALLPVPVGTVGELCVAGPMLARGYLGRPDLSAERFLPDPFSEFAGQRMYRTGDFVRFSPELGLEFHGRRDLQVKVRGQRVELEEIETVLRAYPPVRAAAVVSRPDALGELALHAIVEAEPSFDPEACRKFLRARLVPAALPASFTRLAQLPMNAHGKLDRARLATTPISELPARALHPPAGATEWAIAGIFADLLGSERFDREAHFLDDLGGHSLLAVRLMARLEQRFDRRVALRDILRAPTVAGLASLLEHTRDEGEHEQSLVTLRSSGARAPLVLVHPVEGTVSCYESVAAALSERPVYALQSSDSSRFDSIEALAAHHLAALRAALGDRPLYLGGWSMGAVVAHEMACQWAAAGTQIAGLVVIDRPALQRVDEREHLAQLLHGISRAFGRELAPGAARERTGDAVAWALAEFERAGHVLGAQERAYLAQFVRQHDRHLELLRAYTPRRAAHGALIVRSTAWRASTDAALGWRDYVAEPLVVQALAGDHYSLLRKPAVGLLAETLDSYLGE